MLFPLAIITSQRKAAARRNQLAAFASQREWDFRAEDPTLVERFTGPPVGWGSGTYATNVVLGEHDGRPFVAFDYRVSSIRSESNQQHLHSVVALNLGLRAPDLADQRRLAARHPRGRAHPRGDRSQAAPDGRSARPGPRAGLGAAARRRVSHVLGREG